MSANKWIRPPPNSVDKLEAKGTFDHKLARLVRAYYLSIFQKKAVPISAELREKLLNKIVHQLMLPERAAARAAALRYMHISIEHACHVALGHNDPTHQTARDRGVCRKTVNIACSRYPVHHDISRERARKLLNQFRIERKKLH